MDIFDIDILFIKLLYLIFYIDLFLVKILFEENVIEFIEGVFIRDEY